MKNPAPALDRGLALLHLLYEEGELNLETISNLTQIPKASALRLLETLEANSCIYRDVDTKKYKVLKKLVDAEEQMDEFSRLRRSLLSELADKFKVTSEWFEVFDEGTRLVYRKEPENYLVKVAARVGFVRAFYSSFEAVTKVALANDPELLDLEQEYYNMEWDKKHILETSYVHEELASVKEADFEAKDRFFNPNGVRRVAVGVCADKGALVGVISLAFSYKEGVEFEIEEALKDMRACKQSLEKQLRNMRYMK